MTNGNRPVPSSFDSVDPAPASDELSIEKSRHLLCDDSERMFIRMRALFI